MKDKILETKIALDSLTVLRGLRDDCVISKLYTLIHSIDQNNGMSEWINSYSDFFYTFVQHNGVKSFRDYIANVILYHDSAFARYCEDVEFDLMSSSMIEAVKHDLEYLEKVAGITAKTIKEGMLSRFCKDDLEYEIIQKLPEWNVDNAFKENSEPYNIFNEYSLYEFYRQNGSGEFARYKGFVWERSGAHGLLKGVVSPDPVRFSDLIGYELERKVVIDNTLKFLNGYPANNILLYGDRGTGKSSTIKALLNEYGHMGLRMIEIPKMFLSDFPQVLRLIKNRRQKFIIFIDDLAFGDHEVSYTSLKAVLEGGLESSPENLIIYATSNRRHLIKEKFSDRNEVHATDTLQEKLSLADRFGITVTFSAPDKNKYLEIVEGIAKNRGLDIDRETLHREALKWEMWYNGISPRTARQFVDWLEGNHRSEV